MAKGRRQATTQTRAMDNILGAFERKDHEAMVARAREYFGPVNELANGDKLNALRISIGSEAFAEFMSSALPELGISKSTGYRWAKVASGLPHYFRNPLVRSQLMQIGSGRGILTVDGNGKVRLTPAARTALRQLPPEPRDQNGAKARQWTALLLAAAGKARARARARHAAH